MANRIKTLDKETRTAVASAGGSGRAAALAGTPRAAEIARSGASVTNSPENYAQRIARQWRDLPVARRRVIQQTLSACNGLGVVAPEPKRTRGSKATPSPVEPS